MTYSIVALDAEAGHIGVAVQSHYFGVGALVPWARPGVGVVATQSVVRADYGPRLLDLIESGNTPLSALAALVRADAGSASRQVAVLGVDGSGATHTGSGCIPHAGHAVDVGVRAQANLVKGERVWTSMVDSFSHSHGSLVDRMLAAMEAGQEAGGDLRGQQAAAIRIVTTEATGDLGADTVLDVRVDDHCEPLVELRRLAKRAAAMSGLVRMLEEPGLLTGEPTATSEAVAHALESLEFAQRILGPGNVEPAVWRGLLLARNGNFDAARHVLRGAAAVLSTVPQLLESLSAAGMWPRPLSELLSLVDEPDEERF